MSPKKADTIPKQKALITHSFVRLWRGKSAEKHSTVSGRSSRKSNSKFYTENALKTDMQGGKWEKKYWVQGLDQVGWKNT